MRMCLLIGLLFYLPALCARDFNFATNAKGITEALLKDDQTSRIKVKTRSLSGFNTPKTRIIKAVRKNEVTGVNEQIAIPARNGGNNVNLKIHFDVGSYRIRADSHPLLAELGSALRNSNLKAHNINIIGHTDTDGQLRFNLELSLNRAWAVKHHLTKYHDIDPKRIRVMGLGDGQPLVPNTSEPNKQLNRRVEVVLIN